MDISYIGTFIGVLGFGFALWQHYQVKKLSEHIRAHNWFMYQKINNTNGTLQLALDLYKKKQEIDHDVLEQLARADACGQEVFKEIIKQIQMHEPSFTEDDFIRWKAEGKLTDSNYHLFKQFSTDAKLKS